MSEKLNLLIAEDNENDALLLIRHLKKEGFSLHYQRVQAADTFKEALLQGNWDLVISDFSMPQFTAPDALEILKSTAIDIPFIVISGTVGEAIAVETMRAGAHDYLMKGRLRRLGEAIRRELASAEARRREKESAQQFKIITEASPDAIFIIDEEHHFTYTNPSTSRLLGYSASELGSMSIFDIAPRLPELQHFIDQVRTQGEFTGELDLSTKETLSLPISLCAVLLPNGKIYGSARDLRAQRLAQKRTRDSERLLSFAIKQMPVAVAIAKVPGLEITHYNEKLTAYFDKESLQGEAISFAEYTEGWPISFADDTLYKPQDHPLAKAIIEGTTTIGKEMILRRADQERWLSVSAAPLYDEENKIAAGILVFTEITAEKKAQAALKDSEAHHKHACKQAKTLLEATRAVLEAPDFKSAATTVFKIGAKYLEAPSGYFALLSQDGTENEVVYLEDGGLDCTVDPDLPMPIRGLRALAYQNQRAVFDNDFKNSDFWQLMPEGHVELERVLFAPLQLNGEAVGLFGYANRYSDFGLEEARLAEGLGEIAALSLREYQTQKALRDSEERHRLLFDNSADALMTLAPPHWNFSSGNRAALKLFELDSHEQFLELGPIDFSSELQPNGSSSAAEAPLAIAAALEKGSHFLEWQCKTLEGREFPATVLLTRLEFEGQPFLQATVRDITEYRALQSQIAQADRLSNMGMLAAGVAHEINNPLTYVLYNLESIAEELPTLIELGRSLLDAQDSKQPQNYDFALEEIDEVLLDELLNCTRDALSGTKRIQKIASGLGTFSRVEEKQTVLVNLEQVIEVALNMAFNEIKYRARIVKEFQRIPPVLASEGRLSQVFLNLLINASHAIDEGQVENNQICVKTWTEDQHICASVSDTGSGIHPHNLDKLFQPFFTTKGVGVGSGLGLAISKNIIESYEGSIQVESTLGEGTTFTIRLPIKSQTSQSVERTERAQARGHVKGRLLLIDDEEAIHEAFGRVLRPHTIISARSGREAQKILNKDKDFDLILCDIMMPELSGIDFHLWLREQDPRLAADLIFVTGGAFTPRTRQYLHQSQSKHLEKPIEPVRLREIVDAWVCAKQQSRNPSDNNDKD